MEQKKVPLDSVSEARKDILQTAAAKRLNDTANIHDKEEGLREDLEKLKAKIEEISINTKAGVLEGRHLEPELSRIIQRINYAGKDVKVESIFRSVMVVSINMMKLNIDTEVQNRALVALGTRLHDVTQPIDRVYRDEKNEKGETCRQFTVVLPIVGSNVDFQEVFEDIQSRITSDLSFNLPTELSGDKVPITVSMGYATMIKGEDKNANDLIENAKQYLANMTSE